MISPKISVIVPVYNTAPYLERCLNSLTQQHYSNIEIILVDDGSTDNSAIICDNYASVDNRIKVIHKQNEGVSKARNCGMDIATGDYLSFIDSDDYIELDCYKRVVDTIAAKKCDIVVFNCCITTKQNDIPREVDDKYLGQQSIGNTVESILLSVNPYIWTRVFSAESCRSVRFNNNIHFGEDSVFVYEASRNASKIVSIPDNLLHYVQSENSATRSVTFNRKLITGIDMVDYFVDECQQHFPLLVDVAYVRKIRMMANLTSYSRALSKSDPMLGKIRNENKNLFTKCILKNGIPLKERVKLMLITIPGIYKHYYGCK